MARGAAVAALTVLIIALTPRLASGQLKAAITAALTSGAVPGFIPTPAGTAALGPVIPGAASIGAVASSLGLGPSIASGLGGIAGATGVTALAVLAAHEQKANTLKALCAEVLSAAAQIEAAVKADVTSTGLNLVFTPLHAIASGASAIETVTGLYSSVVGPTLAGIVRLAGDAASGIPALLRLSANVASTVRNAPAAVATTLITGGLRVVGSLQTLTGLLLPSLPGSKVVQLALGAFNRKLSNFGSFWGGLSNLVKAWPGVATSLVSLVKAAGSALGGLGGAELQAVLTALGPATAKLSTANGITEIFKSLGLFTNVINAVTSLG